MLKIHFTAKKTAALVLSGILALASVPAVPAAAETPLAMRIAKVEVDEASLGESRLVSVDVRIEGNENGFIASEFGIAFDERLTLAQVHTDTDAGRCFSYCSLPENHMVWFSGANGTAGAGATNGRVSMLTLDFTLPEHYEARDTYFISYDWSGVDGETAFWYTEPGVDQLTSLMTYSVGGSITIPDPTAPKLNRTELTLYRGMTFELTAQNVDEEGIWFSDDESIATVKDGVVTPVSPGSCNISVYYTQASKLLTCEVNVFDEYHFSMFDSDPVNITSPEDVVWLDYPGAVGSVQWNSSNPEILLVDNGRLTALQEGVVQVFAQNNGVDKMKIVFIKFDHGTGDDPAQSTTSTTTTTTSETTASSTTETTTSFTTSFTTSSGIPLPQPPESSTTTTTTATESDPPADAEAGDLNGDASIDILDVILINKYLLGTTTFDAPQKACADVFHDNVVDSTDALTLLKFVVNLVTELPVEP